jgi:hypothetical protein
MGDVTQMTDGVMSFSLRRLADELGLDRDVLKRRITAAGVSPSGKRGGHPTYRLRDVVPAIFGQPQNGSDGEAPPPDPTRMSATDRKAHWSGERERLKYLADCKQLVAAADVHAEMAFIAKTITRFLATLPDVFERDMRWSPECTEHMEKLTRQLRKELAAKMAEYEDEPGDVHGGS